MGVRIPRQRGGENDHGVSFVFGADIVTNFLRKHGLDLIGRAHHIVADGHEFFASRRLVTFFSATNFCGEFDTAGGMISIDEEDLLGLFQILKPSARTVRSTLSPIDRPLPGDGDREQEASSSCCWSFSHVPKYPVSSSASVS